MTDIELIIKIPEDKYNTIMNYPKKWDEWALNAIRNGTPLPKGHGRLIDADALPLNAIDDANYGSNYIRIAPTIIESDKESEERND